MKVGEDVLGEESGLFDRTVLLFVHRQVGPGAVGFFQAVTTTASFASIAGVAAAASLGLLVARRGFEAALVGVSTAGAALCVWLLKSLVDRSRPALWETQWYWGSSFPSGHTMAAAALGMALVVVVRRIWPAWQRWALTLAVTWIALVGLSRLVLGVHWPTDVIAAACFGALLPLSLNLVDELRVLRRDSTRAA
jgi:undecaprenyl-diphosphatase